MSQDSLHILIGMMAVKKGILSDAGLQEALAEQSRDAATGRTPARLLGQVLVDKGYLSLAQIQALLDEQKAQVAMTIVSSTPAPDGMREEAKESTVFQSMPFGKYTLLRRIGKGGMGIVYEALDTVLNRRVAIKMMIPSPFAPPEETRLDEERFLREAQLSAGLAKHPHIVGVYEAGVIEGKRYLAMEYVDGLQMAEWRPASGVPIRGQIALLRDVALAVHHAHQNGVIHRDLKPANVLVDAKNQPHVTDFGLAKSHGPAIERSITTSGLVVGTPAYMSPEQAQGIREIDGRSDVYSLGVMMYEILTDRMPFDAETPMQMLVQVIEHPVPPPSSVIQTEGHPARDRALEAICLTALAKKPADRYPSAQAFAEALAKWLEGTVPAPRSNRGAMAAVLAASAAVLLLAGALIALRPQPAKATATAAPPARPAASFARRWPILQGHAEGVLAVAFSPAEPLLVSGSADRTVKLWDLRTGLVRATLPRQEGKVEALAISPDGGLLATGTEIEGGGRPGEVRLWEIPSGRLRAELKGHESGVNAVAFSRDGKTLATGDQDGMLRLWDVALAKERLSKKAHDESIRSVAYSPRGDHFATASWDHTAKVWEVSGEEKVALSGHAEGVWSVAFSPDGRTVATASSDRTVKLWWTQTGKCRQTISGHAEEVSSAAFSPDGKLLATGSWDRSAKLWDAAGGRERATYPGHAEPVWSVAFSPDGRTLATAGLDRKIRLWEVPE